MPLRYVLLGEGPLYERCFQWLRQRGTLPLAEWRHPLTVDEYAAHPASAQATVGVAIGYRHLLRPDLLARLPILNLHHGLLPYNRGADPNVWAILDGTPSGTTLHWMDMGVDTGPIVAQVAVRDSFGDTAATLYDRLMDASFALFTQSWQKAEAEGRFPEGEPQRGAATSHRRRDLPTVQQRPLDHATLQTLRACTFPGWPGYRYTWDGRVYDLTLSIREVADDSPHP